MTFTDLALNQTGVNADGSPILEETAYWIVQTNAPAEGYTSVEPTEVTLTPGCYTSTYTTTVYSVPNTVDIEFTKRSADGNRLLSGAVFEIRDKSGNTYTYAPGAVTSGADGKVKFVNLPFGNYEIEETVAPPPHIPITFNVRIEANRTVTVDIERNNDYKPYAAGFNLVNAIADASITVENLDDNDDPVEGAAFTLSRKVGEDWVKVGDSADTDSDGKVKFENLIPYERYKAEAGSIDGHYHPGSGYEFTLGRTGTVGEKREVEWRQHPVVPGSITVTVTDSIRDHLKIAGAGIKLFKGTKEIGNDTADVPDGKVVFDGTHIDDLIIDAVITAPAFNATGELFGEIVYQSTNYTVEEASMPAGYTLNSFNGTVELTNDSDDSRTATLHLTATPRSENITFTHINPWEMPLTNTEFKLTDLDSTFELLISSGTDGAVVFAGVPFGSYTLKENLLSAPYHFTHVTAYTVEISASGVISWNSNDPGGANGYKFANGAAFLTNNFHSASVTIALTDAITGAGVQGVGFKVMDGDIERAVETFTNANGELVISGLMAGRSYSIAQSTPSNSYYPSESFLLDLTAAADGYKEDILWNAYPGISFIAEVLNAANQAPIAGVRFGLYMEDPPKSGMFNLLAAQAVSGADGSLVFPSVLLPIRVSATYATGPALEIGNFQLRELDNVAGFFPLASPITFALSEADDGKVISAEKDPIPPAPPEDGDDYGDDGHVIVRPPGGGSPGPGGAGENSGAGTGGGAGIGSGVNPANDVQITDNTISIIASIIPEDLPFAVPAPASAPETDILTHNSLPEGYSIVQVEADGDIFIVYDETGAPIGFFSVPDDMTLEDLEDILGIMTCFTIDVTDNLMPLAKMNPQTGDRRSASPLMLVLPLALLSGGIAIDIRRKRRLRLR